MHDNITNNSFKIQCVYYRFWVILAYDKKNQAFKALTPSSFSSLVLEYKDVSEGVAGFTLHL